MGRARRVAQQHDQQCLLYTHPFHEDSPSIVEASIAPLPAKHPPYWPAPRPPAPAQGQVGRNAPFCLMSMRRNSTTGGLFWGPRVQDEAVSMQPLEEQWNIRERRDRLLWIAWLYRSCGSRMCEAGQGAKREGVRNFQAGPDACTRYRRSCRKGTIQALPTRTLRIPRPS